MMVFVAAAGAPERSAPSPEAVAYLGREAPRLARLAAGFLTDSRDVEDAVQETLEAAWRSWDTLRDEGSRRAWLTAICVRRCLRVKRWRLRHGTVPLFDDVASSAAPRDLDWDRAFAKLSVSQRVVLSLHYHHGFTLDECADLMGRHPGTVRQHLSRGLARLRKELSDV
jgi:RNA polymerase sigma factor (sigma-70 family)